MKISETRLGLILGVVTLALELSFAPLLLVAIAAFLLGRWSQPA